jgi:hypothetical protein
MVIRFGNLPKPRAQGGLVGLLRADLALTRRSVSDSFYSMGEISS